MKKITLSDQNIVRQKVLSGINKMASIVAPTLGPNGGSVIMERGQEPVIIDDGRRIAENIVLEDQVEQMAVQVAYSVTKKTDEKAGDGTTTSMILTHAILKEAHEHLKGIGQKASVSDIDTQIHQAKNEVLSLMDKEKKDIKTEKDLCSVATVISGDERIGKLVSSLYWELGKDGHISIEIDQIGEKIETETVRGYKLMGGYASPWMITNPLTKTFDAKDVSIFVTNQDITDPAQVEVPSNLVAKEGKPLILIVARSFSQSVIELAYANAKRPQQPFFVILVKPRSEDQYKDLAVFSGATLFTENDNISSATIQDIGHVRSIEIGAENSTFIEGRGKKSVVEAHIKELEAERDKMKLSGLRQPFDQRISAIKGTAGVVKIGAPTDEERNWLKYKVEDTIHGTKHALKEGIIPGGGLTFKKISDSLPDTNILKKPLLAPYETLRNNGVTKVGKDVFDAIVSQKAALEYACSAVSKLVRITGAIAILPIPTLDEAMRQYKTQE